MKRVLIILGSLLLVAVIAIGAAAGWLFNTTNKAMAVKLEIKPIPIAYSNDATAVSYGEHLFITRGCGDCHGENGGGRTIIDAPPLGTFSGSNLTSGQGGVADAYSSVTDWVRAIRHGVDPAGNKLIFMPVHEMYHYSDKDLGSLIAYIQTLAPVDNTPPPIKVGPVPRVLWVSGRQFPLIPADMIAHDQAIPPVPATGPTAEYGAYLLKMCIGCHGDGLSGGPIPGGPPDWPPASNITPHATGLADWTYADFEHLFRQGTLPDGRELNEAMPWKALGQMHDWELQAMWAALQQVPAKPHGNR